MSPRYKAKSITVKITPESFKNNTIRDLWNDVTVGRIPILRDEFGHIDPETWLVAIQDNYSNDRSRYDYTISAETEDYIKELDKRAEAGELKKYHYEGGNNTHECASAAWELVSDEDRTYKRDYEITEPNDGNPYCDIYVSVKS